MAHSAQKGKLLAVIGDEVRTAKLDQCPQHTRAPHMTGRSRIWSGLDSFGADLRVDVEGYLAPAT